MTAYSKEQTINSQQLTADGKQLTDIELSFEIYLLSITFQTYITQEQLWQSTRNPTCLFTRLEESRLL